jgi:chemotaxis protein MotB
MMKNRDRAYRCEDNQVEGWQITYSSLVLVLVVIFVMLVSYSAADKVKMGYLKRSVNAEAGENHEDKVRGRDGGSALSQGQNDGAWINDAVTSIKNSGAASGLNDAVDVQRFGNGIRLRFKSDSFFPSGSADAGKKIYLYLDEISRIVLARDLSVRVEGHTDDVPVHTEEFPSNWELSAKRAVNVVRYFIEVKGLPAGRISAEGFGQYHPVASGSNPDGKKLNRRVEIYIEPAGK